MIWNRILTMQVWKYSSLQFSCWTHWSLGMALRQEQLMEPSYFTQEGVYLISGKTVGQHMYTHVLHVCFGLFFFFLAGERQANFFFFKKKGVVLAECKRLLQGKLQVFCSPAGLCWALLPEEGLRSQDPTFSRDMHGHLVRKEQANWEKNLSQVFS